MPGTSTLHVKPERLRSRPPPKLNSTDNNNGGNGNNNNNNDNRTNTKAQCLCHTGARRILTRHCKMRRKLMHRCKV